MCTMSIKTFTLFCTNFLSPAVNRLEMRLLGENLAGSMRPAAPPVCHSEPVLTLAWESASFARQSLACAFGTQTALRAVSLCERQKKRIATSPPLAAPRNDMKRGSLFCRSDQ